MFLEFVILLNHLFYFLIFSRKYGVKNDIRGKWWGRRVLDKSDRKTDLTERKMDIFYMCMCLCVYMCLPVYERGKDKDERMI